MTTTHNQEETMALAEKFAQTLHGGEVVALHGDLGGGKTTFTKGLAEALKVEETITSPTFVMLKKYDGYVDHQKIELVHIDAYRAETLDDIKSVGIEDFLNRRDVILVVEWAEKIHDILPQKIIDINFKFVNENTREIEMEDENDSSN